MILKIITSIIMWLICIISAISITIAIFFLFRILIWDGLKNMFKKQESEEEILKNLNKYKTFGDIKKR